MKIKSCIALMLLLSLSALVNPQESLEKSLDRKAELREEAVEYLHDTVSEINTLRTVENRISFSSELANLMWFHDEEAARTMFSGVADNFVQLLTDYNARVMALGGMQDGSDSFSGFGLGGGGNERTQAVRKMYKAGEVRKQIALAIAEHDGQFGYEFVLRTAAVVTDKQLAATFFKQNRRLEKQILSRMSARNTEQSLAFARQSLKRGFSLELVQLAVKIFKKDPEEAIEFGKELIDKVRSEAKAEQPSFANIYAVLNAGSSEDEAIEGQKPLFENDSLTSLAELLAGNLIRAKEADSRGLAIYVEVIRKYSPVQAKRVEDVIAARKNKEARSNGDKIESFEVPAPPAAAENLAKNGRDKEQKELMKELGEFGDKELSSEQKSEFISRARRIVSEMSDPTKKIFALTMLATQVKKLGDSELALEIMREGSALVRPNPTNYLDYMLTWTLASGYAQIEPGESFPLIEDAIFRLNDTIGAFVKVAQFIDVQGEIVIDGEFQLGAFGGSMTRGAVGIVRGAGNVVKSLAEADFERTKALADKFEQPEVRVLARFIVLRSLLVDDETEDIGLF